MCVHIVFVTFCIYVCILFAVVAYVLCVYCFGKHPHGALSILDECDKFDKQINICLCMLINFLIVLFQNVSVA